MVCVFSLSDLNVFSREKRVRESELEREDLEQRDMQGDSVYFFFIDLDMNRCESRRAGGKRRFPPPLEVNWNTHLIIRDW